MFAAKNKEKGPKTADLKKFNLDEKLCEVPDKTKPIIKEKVGKSAADLTSLCKSKYTNIVAVQNTKTILKEFLDNGLLEDIADLMEISP